jgi:dienelactone hydrolase
LTTDEAQATQPGLFCFDKNKARTTVAWKRSFIRAILHSGATVRLILIGLFALTTLAYSQSFQTTVAPLPNETLAGQCQYDLSLPAGHREVRAVWVTFDRGLDIMKFYSDPEVIAFARRHDLALMMPHQCPAKNAPGGPREMDMDPSHGVGRALFTALDQFAHQTGHAELSSAKLILLGFSGTGALFAHFVGYTPDRIVASIPADPGHYDPVGVDNVKLPAVALGVPELILTGGADKICGTQRPYDYFRLYRNRGAPWAFLVQNKTPHCCIINAKLLMLAWLEEIIKMRQPSSTNALRKIDTSRGWLGFIRTCPSDVHDDWGAATWDVCDASIQPVGRAAPTDKVSAGWLPSHRVATQWLEFVKQRAHPTTSLP